MSLFSTALYIHVGRHWKAREQCKKKLGVGLWVIKIFSLPLHYIYSVREEIKKVTAICFLGVFNVHFKVQTHWQMIHEPFTLILVYP